MTGKLDVDESRKMCLSKVEIAGTLEIIYYIFLFALIIYYIFFHLHIFLVFSTEGEYCYIFF